MKQDTRMNIIICLLAISMICLLIQIANAEAKTNPGLTIILKLQYKSYHNDDPENIGQMSLVVYDDNNDKVKGKTLFLDDQPKSVKVSGLPIAIGEKFQICLSSYDRDEGNCDHGINHPKKAPEIASVTVP